MTKETTLILGGARSGKTRRALQLAEPFAQRIYIATAEARDDEMEARIAKHKTERGAGWSTIEAPLKLSTAIDMIDDKDTVGVIDCLTLWLSNIILGEQDIQKETKQLLNSISIAKCELIFVSNEVGLGLVPESKLGRNFRDAQGQLNQQVASISNTVEFVAAGLPFRLKP